MNFRLGAGLIGMAGIFAASLDATSTYALAPEKSAQPAFLTHLQGINRVMIWRLTNPYRVTQSEVTDVHQVLASGYGWAPELSE
jgi:hypothetical protein